MLLASFLLRGAIILPARVMIGAYMRVSTNVRAVQVPDDNPMHPQFTTMYLVGEGQAFTIDSGEDLDRYRWMLRGYLAAVEKAEIGLSGITHHHSDHSANLAWLRQTFGAEIYVHTQGEPLLHDRLPTTGVHMMSDEQTIEISGGVKVVVLHTPGHSVDSVCYYMEDDGVLFSGDTILGATTTTVQDLSSYMTSLDRLRQLPNLKVICPGHGPLIWNPREWIAEYIAHRNEREQQILAVLNEGGELTSWDIMMRIYTDLDPRKRRPADGNVRQHLQKLEREGRLKVHPGMKKARSAEEVTKVQAEEEEHERVIAQAEEYMEQSRHRVLYLQENPPTDEWEDMPKYELDH